MRLRAAEIALSSEARDSLRERLTTAGVERVARHLGVADRAVLSACAGVPSSSTGLVLARLAERGLPNP